MEVQSHAPIKRHFDITKSRRTRRSLVQVQTNNEKPKSVINDTTTTITTTTSTTTTKDNNVVVSFDQTPSRHNPEVKETSENNCDHKSLKQLINGDEKLNDDDDDDDARIMMNSGKKNSLGEHFNEEEKQLQLVLVPQKDKDSNNNNQGLKFKKLVRRYAKVLGNLMKSKRDPHLAEATGKKPIFKLST